MKGLTIRITEEMHSQLKMLMIITGDTVQNYVTNLLEQDFKGKDIEKLMNEARSGISKNMPDGNGGQP